MKKLLGYALLSPIILTIGYGIYINYPFLIFPLALSISTLTGLYLIADQD